jgi:hypothetical protein
MKSRICLNLLLRHIRQQVSVLMPSGRLPVSAPGELTTNILMLCGRAARPIPLREDDGPGTSAVSCPSRGLFRFW